MKVIITGGTGFIGKNFADYFRGRGDEVIALSRSPESEEPRSAGGPRLVRADIRNKEELLKKVPAGDCLIHCAGKMADWGRYEDFHLTNVTGTENVLAACREKEISRIVFISTPSVYFSGENRIDVRESEPLPKNQFPYGRTKLLAEDLLLDRSADGPDVIIFRPRAVYGPHDNTIVPRILQLSQKKRFPLINNGTAFVDLTYIGNLVLAVEKGLNAPADAWNQIYNISNGDPVSVREWFAEVLRIFGRPFRPKNIPEPAAAVLANFSELASRLPFGSKKPAMTRFSVGYMAKSLTMSIKKAGDMLGYAPVTGNRRGFEIYRDWVDNQQEE